MWEVFAKRGLGITASQGISFDYSDGREAFDIPSKEAAFDFALENVCTNTDIITRLCGGTPLGGVYSGLGVIDDGNGITFSFDPKIAGIGTHNITYEISDSRCSIASLDEGSITVVVDAMTPEIICLKDIKVTIPIDEEFYEIIDFSNRILTSDNCYSAPVISQQPVAGIPLDVGTITMNMKATGAAGNYVICSFKLTVEKEVKDGDAILEIYPNPVKNKITLSSYKEIEALTAHIIDINGRIILKKQYDYFGFENKLNFENIAPGMYFLKIESEKFNVVKRILKQ